MCSEVPAAACSPLQALSAYSAVQLFSILQPRAHAVARKLPLQFHVLLIAVLCFGAFQSAAWLQLALGGEAFPEGSVEGGVQAQPNSSLMACALSVELKILSNGRQHTVLRHGALHMCSVSLRCMSLRCMIAHATLLYRFTIYQSCNFVRESFKGKYQAMQGLCRFGVLTYYSFYC